MSKIERMLRLGNGTALNMSSNTSAIPAFGNFDSLGLEPLEKEMLHSGFQAVESVEGGWEFLRTYEPPADQGFMFSLSTGKRLEIDDAISNRYGGHSGSSYGWTMRNLEFIAKEGWDAFVKARLEEKKREDLRKGMEEKRKRFLALPKDMTLEEQFKAMEEFKDVPMSYAEMRERFG